MRHLRDKAACSIPIKGSALVKLLPRHTQSMQICVIYSLYSVCTGEMTGWSHECCVTFKCGDITNWVKKAMCRPWLPFQPWSYFLSQPLAFCKDMKECGTWKGKFGKPFLSLTFISYSKQMRDPVGDESKSMALSLPLKVTRLINLYRRGSQIVPCTLPTPLAIILVPSFFGSKGCLLSPPLTLLSDVSCLKACE